MRYRGNVYPWVDHHYRCVVGKLLPLLSFMFDISHIDKFKCRFGFCFPFFFKLLIWKNVSNLKKCNLRNTNQFAISSLLSRVKSIHAQIFNPSLIPLGKVYRVLHITTRITLDNFRSRCFMLILAVVNGLFSNLLLLV